MKNLDILKEIAKRAGYTVEGSTTQIVANKSSALARLNTIKADFVGRFGGKWDAMYREGWLPIVPNYTTGTATFTLDSRTVTGSGTVWTTSMKGYKILGPDGAWYRIASVGDSTTLYLTQPYQSATTSGSEYTIWKDEYRLYPEVFSLGGFVNYNLSQTMTQLYQKDMKSKYPVPSSSESPYLYTVIGRDVIGTAYTTGTVTGSTDSNILTGTNTSWLDNIEPGFLLTISTTTYTVKRVNSDTELELYQLLASSPSGSTYSAVGKNALVVRFEAPTIQKVLHYWYWAKDWPFVNDSDEDWVAEMFPNVLQHGISMYDYMDKNDPVRSQLAAQIYENAIHQARQAVESGMAGPQTLPLDIPDSARD